MTLQTERLIAKDMPWYVQPTDRDTIAIGSGFINTTAITDSVQVGEMTIIRITGSHGRGNLAEMMGASSGYMLKAEGQPTLYVMGDCVWDEATKNAVKRYCPNYIVVNSGGAIFPTISKTEGPIIPNEAETMQIIDECSPNTRFIAVHMDAIDHCQTTRAILRNEARHHGVSLRPINYTGRWGVHHVMSRFFRLGISTWCIHRIV